MDNKQAIKVSILDDHPLVNEGLRQLLKQYPQIEILSAFNNPLDLLDGFASQLPDVLLLDIQLPGMNGDEVAYKLLKSYPDLRIIILTNIDYPSYIIELLDIGCMAYLLKSSSIEEIYNAIITVNGYQKYIPQNIADVINKYKLAKNSVYRQQMILTNREKEILQLIAQDFSSNEIAEKLFISKRTVDAHRNSLLFKLDVKSSAGLVKRAIDLGLIK